MADRLIECEVCDEWCRTLILRALGDDIGMAPACTAHDTNADALNATAPYAAPSGEQ